MTVPCVIGFRCPFRKYTDDSDLICIYPYIVGVALGFDSGERKPDFSKLDSGFPITTKMEVYNCPLMVPDSRLENLLRGVR